MSTFAFGICVSNSISDYVSFAHDVEQYVLSANSEFYVKFGGNATSYWAYKKDSKLTGYVFEITDSIVENTAQRAFQLNDEDFSYAKLEYGPLFNRLSHIQGLLNYMLQSESVQEILLHVLVDYDGSELEDNAILCPVDSVVSTLWERSINNSLSNIALRIQR